MSENIWTYKDSTSNVTASNVTARGKYDKDRYPSDQSYYRFGLVVSQFNQLHLKRVKFGLHPDKMLQDFVVYISLNCNSVSDLRDQSSLQSYQSLTSSTDLRIAPSNPSFSRKNRVLAEAGGIALRHLAHSVDKVLSAW